MKNMIGFFTFLPGVEYDQGSEQNKTKKTKKGRIKFIQEKK